VTGIPEVDLSVLAPIGFVAIGAMVVLVGEILLSRARTFMGRPMTESYIGTSLAGAAVFFLALAFYVAAVAFATGDSAVFLAANPMFQLDRFSSFITAILALSALLTCALSITYLAELRINHGEYYALVLLSVSGMMLLVASVDLIALFLGFELMSIPVYVLAGFDRRKLRSNESAIKYFVIGSFASAVMLYGMALLYGATGSTSFDGIRDVFDPASPGAMIGLGLVVVGFAFKIASVPFHQWAPDVYEGAPSVVTAFMSVAVKTAAFAALARLTAAVFAEQSESLSSVFWALSALTMVVGNVMAVIQENVKRMLAYSSIAHAGYLLVGLTAGGGEGFTAIAFYLVVYTFMNLGAFGVVVALAQHGQDFEKIDGFAGLARQRPGLAAVMTLFMLSLAGIPGTAGFMAKFNIFFAAVHADMIWLPVVLVLTSVVSVFYYLRIPVQMYMREPSEQGPRMDIASGEALVLVFCAAAVLFFGIFPNEGALPFLGLELPLLDWASESVRQFFGP
jgi:NADH-quinone oxidoreductase subunit N